MSYVLDTSGVNSPECRQLEVQSVDTVEKASGVPGTVLFEASDAFLEHDGPENNYKPYLMILGRPLGVQADLPHNVSLLRYQSDNDLLLMSYRYDFTRENLSHMALNGLYEPGFQPSELARTGRYELPCEISYVAFPPDERIRNTETGDVMPPVVFASLQPLSLHCTDEETGYEIHNYFDTVPEVTQEEQVEAQDEAAYELPDAARVIGTEFSFAGNEPQMLAPVAKAVQAAQNGPDTDVQEVSEEQVPVAPETPEMGVSEPEREVPDLSREKAAQRAREQLQAAQVAAAEQARRPARPHNMSGLDVSGESRPSIEDEFVT